MSKQLGLDVLDPNYHGDRVPVMEHFSPLSREAIVALTQIDPVAEPSRLEEVWDKLAVELDVDLLWGGPLADTGLQACIVDWTNRTSFVDAEGQEHAKWGIFSACHAEDGRHYMHIPKPDSIDDALDFESNCQKLWMAY